MLSNSQNTKDIFNQRRRIKMADSNIIISLAKVMVAAAWTDGVITNDEMNSLKDLLFHMKGMTAKDWAKIDIYLDSPVEEAERQRLVNDLLASLASPADRDLAIQSLEQLSLIGGEVGEAEQAAIQEIKDELQNGRSGEASRWRLFTRGQMNGRSQTISQAPNRELAMDDFINNKIYYDLTRNLASRNAPQKLPEEKLRKLSLAAGLMARVTFVDGQVTEVEKQGITQALEKFWSVSPVEAELVAELAVSEIVSGLDYYRLTRQFFECTTEAERVAFLDALFAAATGDGRASYDEIEEIRSVAIGLLLNHQQFIDAKLKVPSESRVS
jgi:uncharacterized tellurite resistance protein B-like protein